MKPSKSTLFPFFALGLLMLSACDSSSRIGPPPVEIEQSNAKLVVSASTETLRLVPANTLPLSELLLDAASYGRQEPASTRVQTMSRDRVRPQAEVIANMPFSRACENGVGTIEGSFSASQLEEGNTTEYRRTISITTDECVLTSSGTPLEMDGTAAVTSIETQIFDNGRSNPATGTKFLRTMNFRAFHVQSSDPKFIELVGSDIALSGGIEVNVSTSAENPDENVGPIFTVFDLNAIRPEDDYQSVTLASGSIEYSQFQTESGGSTVDAFSLATDKLVLALHMDDGNNVSLDLSTDGALTVVDPGASSPSSIKQSPLATDPEAFLASRGKLVINGANNSNITLDTAVGNKSELGYRLNGGQQTTRTHESLGANFDYEDVYFGAGL